MLKATITKKNNILAAAKKIEEGTDRGLDDIIDLIFMRSQQLVSKDEGTLQKSAKPVLKEHLRKEVVYRALHARFVEFGTDPRERMPPVDVIERWCRRKHIKHDGKTYRQTAWTISKFIQKRGTEPHPYLRPACNEAEVRMKEFVSDEVKVSISKIR